MTPKACPVALHPDGAPRRIAAFTHPQAGLQLVKGTIEEGENRERAAARELFEESGLETRAALYLGHSDTISDDQIWHFTLCRITPPVRDRWQHYCSDDGGHLLQFFWHRLDAPTPDDFAETHARALDWIREHT